MHLFTYFRWLSKWVSKEFKSIRMHSYSLCIPRTGYALTLCTSCRSNFIEGVLLHLSLIYCNNSILLCRNYTVDMQYKSGHISTCREIWGGSQSPLSGREISCCKSLLAFRRSHLITGSHTLPLAPLPVGAFTALVINMLMKVSLVGPVFKDFRNLQQALFSFRK